MMFIIFQIKPFSPKPSPPFGSSGPNVLPNLEIKLLLKLLSKESLLWSKFPSTTFS